MPEPLTLPGSSARHQLAFLYPGQAQKEMLVNEALCRLDILLHPVIAGVSGTPPAEPQEGESWLVGPGATGAWAGRADQIAGFCAGTWMFCSPHPGMRLWHASAGHSLLFSGGWVVANTPATPSGGTIVDVEARGAIAALIATLAGIGLLAQ